MKFEKEWEQYVQIPVLFLKEYICDAPPEYVKIYLFGLYLAQYQIPVDITDLEDRLHLSSDKINSALNYWSKKGFIELNGESARFVIPESGQSAQKATEPLPEILYEKSEYNQILNKLLKRQLTHSQLQRIYDFTDVFKLPESVVISMIEHCVTVKGPDVGIAYLDKVAKSWAEKGVSTPKQAQELIDEYNLETGGAKKIMKQMGITGKLPGAAETAYYEKWTKKWSFTPDAILFAMKDTEFAAINKPFKYLDEILRSYKEKGITTASQIFSSAEADKEELSGIKEAASALSLGSRAVNFADYREYYKKWKSQGAEHKIIIAACKQCAKRGKPNLESVEKLICDWRSQGLTDGEKLAEYLSERRSKEEFIEQAYDKAGITKQIGDRDVRLFDTLLGKYQMSKDTLLFAAEISAANAKDPYTYFKKILRIWAERGIKTVEQARSHDDSVKAAKPAKPNAKPGFAQREFDEQAEKERRIMEMLKEGERINAQQTNS